MSIIESTQLGTRMLLGEVASSGVARGTAMLCDCAERTTVPRRQVSAAEVERELERFDGAVAAAASKLREVQASVERSLGKDEAAIFEAQVYLVRDARLRSEVRRVASEERLNAEAAVDEAIRRLTVLFEQIEDTYFRERVADLRDVGRRLQEHLAQERQPALPVIPDGQVLVTDDLLSSAAARLEGHDVRGLIVEKGGLTAHATILARALGIPMLVHVEGATKRIRSGEPVILDALAGRVFVDPDVELLAKYDRLEADLRAHQSALKGLLDLPAVTPDGTAVKLSANVDQVADAVAAARVKAEGVGLYRTEFVFLAQDHFPSEAEQYQFYRATAEHMQPGETVVRVLDVGSDKLLSYFPLPHEDNPALGRRGLRLLLAFPEVLHTQLRAILRVSASHPVAILLPMIGGVDDLRAARAALDRAKAELTREGQPFDPQTKLGAMIETPAAAVLLAPLADAADFLNVGTNDLVQYMLAADRLGGEGASFYEPLHPAVLHVLATLAKTAAAARKPICLCGEMAGDPANTALLLGLGFRSFSVSPGRLLEIKHAVRTTPLSEAEALAARVLASTATAEIKACVEADWLRRNPVVSPSAEGEPGLALGDCS